MKKDELLHSLKSVEKIATESKLLRMLSNPYKYINAIFFREVIYSFTKNEKLVQVKTFFGKKMNLLLPSSTDIYLTGGKSHESEIRLARYLILNLNIGDDFIDVGAHYGYFSMLASDLVSGGRKEGRVFSFEASPTSYAILQKNIMGETQVKAYNKAVSDSKTKIPFFEFPNMYSEYNSFDIDQYKNEPWFNSFLPKEIMIETVYLDTFIDENAINPKIIKIDVEGAELLVVKGLLSHLQNHDPTIIMEYVNEARGNQAHQDAEILLNSNGYKSYLINNDGTTLFIPSVNEYMEANNIESENIVFLKG